MSSFYIPPEYTRIYHISKQWQCASFLVGILPKAMCQTLVPILVQWQHPQNPAHVLLFFFSVFPFAIKVWCSQDGHLRERKYQGLLHAGVVSLVRWPFRWDDLKKNHSWSSQAKVAAWYFVIIAIVQPFRDQQKRWLVGNSQIQWILIGNTSWTRFMFYFTAVLLYQRVQSSDVWKYWMIFHDTPMLDHVREFTLHQNGPCRAPAVMSGFKTPFIAMFSHWFVKIFSHSSHAHVFQQVSTGWCNMM